VFGFGYWTQGLQVCLTAAVRLCRRICSDRPLGATRRAHTVPGSEGRAALWVGPARPLNPLNP
jgi:hypothetical protein